MSSIFSPSNKCCGTILEPSSFSHTADVVAHQQYCLTEALHMLYVSLLFVHEAYIPGPLITFFLYPPPPHPTHTTSPKQPAYINPRAPERGGTEDNAKIIFLISQ